MKIISFDAALEMHQFSAPGEEAPNEQMARLLAHLPDAIERELTETELTALGRYLAIRDVQNVLSCSPFARPEDIDLCGMLYATDSSALSAGERKALLSLAGSGVVENAAFSRLTTREIEALTEKYLGITFNDALRQRMLNEQSVYCGSVYYLDGYDAYYLPHNDTNLIVPELLQGWLTEDGSYLIRYREALTGDGHYICLLKPADDGYRIRMMLNLEEALADPKEPSDTTEPPETSETETDPPVDTTKPPETSKKEPVTTEPPETACRHDDGKWVTVKEPDCSNSGIAEFVCSCGEKQTKVLSATHTYRDGVCEECGEAEPVYSTGLFFVYIDARDAYAVRGIGSCKSRDLVIPPTYNDKPVIGIQTNAFYENAFITSVVLPPSIEYIGSSAFAHALSLKMITFGDGVTAIGDYAFAYTSSLKTVTLGSGVVTIGDYAFSNTKSLTTLNIRGDVSSIGSFAFYRSAITDFTIPKGLTTIMDCAFFESNISSPVIHGGITSIGKQAFAGCSNLGDVRIEEGVISIGEKAFSGACITSLSLPSTLKEIASDAFICAAQYLETISVASDNRFYSSNGGCLIELDGKTVLLGSADAIIPTDGSVTAIGDYAFYLIERRGKPLEIPHGIVRIGEAAFYYCHLEGTLLLPDSVIALGAHAFSGNLYETVIIGKGITEIPEGAFAGNSLMRELVLHSNIVSFSPTSFLNVGLEVLIIPDGITEIDGFRNNTSLKKVVFGKDVAKIADEAFLNCFSLKEVVFENVESLKSVGKDAFLGCLSLEIYPPELMPTS